MTACLLNRWNKAPLCEEHRPKRRGFGSFQALLIISVALVALSWSEILLGQSAILQPQETIPELREAKLAMREHRYGDAEVALRTIEHALPSSSAVHFLLAEALLRQNEPKESLVEYTEGARWGDPGPIQLVGVASDYVLMNDYADAEKWLTLAVQKDPTMANGWYLLGRTQFNEHKLVEAEKAFLQCLRVDLHHAKAENNLGLVYENTQRTKEALRAYQNAIDWQKLDSVNDPQPSLNMGKLLRLEGRSNEALPFLLEAKTSAPLNPAVLQELGLAYEQLGEIPQAIAEIESAVALAPDVEALHFFLGRMYRKRGRLVDAQRQYELAAKKAGYSTIDTVPNDIKRP